MSNATETWLPVAGFEGKYEVSGELMTKLGLTRLERRLQPFEPTGRTRKKFFIYKDDDHGYWFVLIPTILRSFPRSKDADWYAFDTFEDARAWVARQLTYSRKSH